MKYLKANIFYPRKYNKISIARMRVVGKKYEKYLVSIEDKYDRGMLSLYKKTGEFHDFKITNLYYECVKNKNILDLTLISRDNDIYQLNFKGINGFNVTGFLSNKEDIVLCEIGMSKKIYYICFHFANGCEIQIDFKHFIWW